MDLRTIEEAQARENIRRTGDDVEYGGQRRTDRALLLAAVPGLLAEIERLKAHAAAIREAWAEIERLKARVEIDRRCGT